MRSACSWHFAPTQYGMYGDLVLAPTRAVVKHPSVLSWEEAAANVDAVRHLNWSNKRQPTKLIPCRLAITFHPVWPRRCS
jgi:hypothetical protein